MIAPGRRTAGREPVGAHDQGAVAGDTRRVWRADWRYQATLPELVRVRLVFDPGDARQWPDLIMRLRANSNTACQLDPVTHHCRTSA